MKKIIAFISIISIASVLASCGNKETSTEPKPKTCEQIEPCKTALKYTTYIEQGASDKAYRMETKDENLVSYDNEKEAKEHILSDYKKYQDLQIKKYGLLEYEVIPNKKYVYKFRFEDFRNGEVKNLTVGVSRQNDKYLTNSYIGGALKSDVKYKGAIVPYKKYYSNGLTKGDKITFSPEPVENY
ncbi:hypothetical protein [Priestia megaterium]|uniref:hypothetical protein n=1 Tax=Priestia megaterium TaxID=1404 RepID=UPI00112BBB88|nr:hypothetical protein [Priestia megaterium]